MTDFLLCIACLSSKIKMCSLQNIELPKIFETLTNITLSNEEKVPKLMCYICYSQLQKCCRFINMSQKAGRILTQLLSDGVQLTQATVSALEERATKNFVTTNLKATSIPSVASSTDGNNVDTSFSYNEEETMTACSNNVSDSKVMISLKKEPNDIDEQMTIEEDFVIKEEPLELQVGVASTQEAEEVKDCVQQKHNKVIKELKASIENQIEGNQSNTADDTIETNNELLTPRRKYNKKKDKDAKKTKNHVCDICAVKFSCKAYLMRHMRIHTGEKPYACKSCEKTFAQNGHLIQHMRVHTGEKPYVCHICQNKAFNHRYNYKTHMRKHFGVPSHTCDMCNSAFHQKGDLKRHMMSHTGEKPYTCTTCDMKFTQNCHLTKHIKLHTREPPACPYCGQKFEQKVDLNNHLKTHAGNLFPCPIKGCSKSFNRKGMLTNHIESHTVERPFACEKCDRKFKQKGHLTKHTILTHDNIKHERQQNQTKPLKQDELKTNQYDLKMNQDELKLKHDVKPNLELLQDQDHLQEHVEEYIIP